MSGGLSDAMIFEEPATNIVQMAVTVARVRRMIGVILEIEPFGDKDEESLVLHRPWTDC